MRISDLNLNEAPACGVMLAYTRKDVLLESYGSLEEVCSKLDQAELLEIHLFDENKEYRAVKSESRRWNSDQNGIIQKVVNRSDFDDTYDVEVILDQEYRNKMKKTM